MNTLTEALAAFPGITIEGGVQYPTVWQILMDVEPTPEGWRSLEFIAWAVQELKREGLAVMVEATARPPHRNEPGRSLRFLLHGAEDTGPSSSAARVASFLEEQRGNFIPVERE